VHLFTSDEPVRDILIAGIAELDDDVVYRPDEARIANQRQRNASARIARIQVAATNMVRRPWVQRG
jgi:hypothetical protein